jgi:A/G-specific adenine glycosylase
LASFAIMPKLATQQQLNATRIDANAVLAWYDAHARTLPWRVSPADRARGVEPDPYRVWLSEIMLQQTTVAAVVKYFNRFTTLWPTVGDLAAAPLEAVLVEWAGLGYYARARNLHACATTIARQLQGIVPKLSTQLQALPGIGAYTSAAISAIAFDEPIAVIDGNVDRVLARYLALEVPVRDAKDTIRQAVQQSVPPRAGDFAQALMDLGATICTPRAALCMLCPLQPVCLGARASPLNYPVKLEKAMRPTRYGHAFVLLDADGDVYLQTRAEKGLLAKMTETPGSPWTGFKSDPEFPIAAQWHSRGEVIHIFTHFRLELQVWSTTIAETNTLSKGWWADPAELSAEALPSLFLKVLSAAAVGNL